MNEPNYAGFWIRTGAALIDTLLLLIIIAPILTAIYGTEYWVSEFFVQGIWDVLFNYILPAIAVIVFWVCKSATPGKIILKLTIIDAKTGGKPSVGQFIGRYFGYYVSLIPFCLGIIWVGIDKRKQGWHDKLAGTFVVRNILSESFDSEEQATGNHGVDRGMNKQHMLSDLARNLSAGFRLLFFVRLEAEDFRPSLKFVCTSLVVCLLIVAGFDYAQQVGEIYFNDSGAAKLGSIFFFLLLTSIVVSRMQREIRQLPLLLTVIFSTLPWYLVFLYLLRDYSGVFAETTALWFVAFALGLSVLLRAAKIVFPVPGFREYLVISGAALFLSLLAWNRLFVPEVFFSYNPDDFALYAQIDQEDIYFQQPRLLAEKLNTLQPEAPGQADVYFVGFAGNGDEPVFAREVNFVRDMMDRSFLTEDRSILLASNLDNLTTEPLANTHNLETAINAVGHIMDVENDVLFLFLTSHGSDDSTLQVALYPFDLKSLGSLDLRRYLDNSGILWRVIIISACYSGSFIDSLATDRTLIITAAALDKTSFGCSVDRDLTYFGEAFFNEERLAKNSFITAFQGAKETIQNRELSEGLIPSDPQMFIGALISEKLEAIWPTRTTR